VKISKAFFKFILNYASMKLFMLMKNIVFHSHEKFHKSSVGKQTEKYAFEMFTKV